MTRFNQSTNRTCCLNIITHTSCDRQHIVVTVTEVGGNSNPPPLNRTKYGSIAGTYYMFFFILCPIMYKRKTSPRNIFPVTPYKRPRRMLRYQRRSAFIGRWPPVSTTNTRRVMLRTPGATGVTETKYFDEDVGALGIGNTWQVADPTIDTLFAPMKGTSLNQRIGNRVLVKKIRIRGRIFWDGKAGISDILSNDYVRCILVLDTQTNGTQLTAGNLMAGPGLDINDFQNTAGFGRYIVLKDKIIRRPAVNAVGTADDWRTDNTIVPFKMSKTIMRYFKFNDGNAGTVGDILDNSLHMVVVKDETGSTQSANIRFTARTVFADP